MKLYSLLFIILLIFTFFLKSFTLYGQDLNYAKGVIEILCSPDFHGRGYVSNGDKKAAQFIANEFKKIGLASFDKTYFQNFTIPVNTLPGDLELIVGGKKLIPGIDYLANPCAPSTKGKFKVLELLKESILNDQELKNQLKHANGKFIVIDRKKLKGESKENQKRINDVVNFLKFSEGVSAAGIVEITDDKLTWHASSEVCKIPSFIIYAPEDFKLIQSIQVKVENKFINTYTTQNVVGYIKGSQNPDSVIVFSAHYDHLGRMGADTYFPGANDNASGTALMLDLARHYSLAENRPTSTIVFIAFGAEEIGLLGSKYYVENPYFPLGSIKMLINMDIAGTGDEGITVVNGQIFNNEFTLLKNINEEYQLLPQIKSRGEACNSDHCFFYMKGVPSFFIYTLGGIKAYHDVYDIAETLPLTKYEAYFNLMTLFISKL